MENLFKWYSLALKTTTKRKTLTRRLERAQRDIKEIEYSAARSSQKLLELAEKKNITVADISVQEKHVLIVSRHLIRKRALLIQLAGEHFLKFIKNVKERLDNTCETVSSEDLSRIKEKIEEARECLSEEGGLPKTKKKEKINEEIMGLIPDVLELIQHREIVEYLYSDYSQRQFQKQEVF